MSEVIDDGDPRAATGDGAAEELDAKVVSRRDALKKAAIGAGIAGAVWSAPRIEGLSLVPDYAAAGTIPPGSTIQIKATVADCSPSILNNTNCWGSCTGGSVITASNCTPFRFTAPAYAPQSATGVVNPAMTGAPPANLSMYSSTNMLSAPPPPGPNQHEFFDVVFDGNADHAVNNVSGMAAVMFSLDPPFNMCSVTMVQGQVFSFDIANPTGHRVAWAPADLTSVNNTSPTGVVTGAAVTLKPPGPTGLGGLAGKQGADVTITITCT